MAEEHEYASKREPGLYSCEEQLKMRGVGLVDQVCDIGTWMGMASDLEDVDQQDLARDSHLSWSRLKTCGPRIEEPHRDSDGVDAGFRGVGCG